MLKARSPKALAYSNPTGTCLRYRTLGQVYGVAVKTPRGTPLIRVLGSKCPSSGSTSAGLAHQGLHQGAEAPLWTAVCGVSLSDNPQLNALLTPGMPRGRTHNLRASIIWPHLRTTAHTHNVFHLPIWMFLPPAPLTSRGCIPRLLVANRPKPRDY